jgi:hypothetical protein
MDDREMKEFLTGTQVGLEAGIANMEGQIRSTRDLRDKVSGQIEELKTVATLEELKRILIHQTIVRRDSLNGVVEEMETQLAKLKDMLKTSQEALKG